MKTFDQLFAELTERQRTGARSARRRSRRSTLGVHAQGKKVVEERPRCGWPPNTSPPDRTAEEMSQLLYRLQVIMLGKGIGLTDVYRHL